MRNLELYSGWSWHDQENKEEYVTRHQNNEKHKYCMQSYKDLVGAKMTNQLAPKVSTWDGKFFEDSYLLLIKQAKDFVDFVLSICYLMQLW